MTKSTKKQSASTETVSHEASGQASTDVSQQIQGRSVFGVETTAAGIAVNTLFFAEDGRMMPMPAVFPTLTYALEQIEELRNLVIQHFSQAAQVGVHIIAAQNAKAAQENAQQAAAEAPAGN